MPTPVLGDDSVPVTPPSVTPPSIPDPDPVDSLLADLRNKQAAVVVSLGNKASADLAVSQAQQAVQAAQQAAKTAADQLTSDMAARDQSRAALEAALDHEYSGPSL